MLNYLGTSTRPDIAFAVHQCARFSSNPKRVHEIAVRRIVRYLKGTKDKGYILQPSASRTLDCYVDADFAGLWSSDIAHDPISVKSRTGYVITFASCPILWSSKLQTKIALSTTEAEYIAMSQATRDLIPMRDLLSEFASATKLIVGDTITHSTIFEGNLIDLTHDKSERHRTKVVKVEELIVNYGMNSQEFCVHKKKWERRKMRSAEARKEEKHTKNTEQPEKPICKRTE